jgi:glycosyltransferase involved in cell wall biosynthesis
MPVRTREEGENGQVTPLRSIRRRAVVTIVSGNYIARARALCRSLAEHEPNVRRFVLIVDRPVSSIVRKDEPFDVIRVEDLAIPEFEDFMAQYTVIEANTAVKPYVLRHLFERHAIDQVVYLDPDIIVMAPLDEIWRGLDHGNVVLTPHLRDPFRDNELPNELEILRSGTYNLGFIGLTRGPSSLRMLEWWCEKTEHDCAIDLANGLFVDQKWIDLVPGYVDAVVVVRDAGYNVAYWNLHEREVTERSGKFFADGRPITFFHFSGYDPDRPWVMSRHQSRHDLHSLPLVKRLFDAYARQLQEEGYEQAIGRPYGFGALSNGVPISPVIRTAVRSFRKRRIHYPSVRYADDFCRFLMTPNAAVSGTEIAPFAHYVLEQRGDVAAAFPRARSDADDPGFHNWLDNSAHEVDAELLCKRFRSRLKRVNPFTRIARVYADREDLRAAFPSAFRTREGLDGLTHWLRWYGLRETDIDHADVEAFGHGGESGFESVLEYYLGNPDLHAQFPLGLLPGDRAFVDWLIRNATRAANLSVAQILWFERRLAEIDPNTLVLLIALRNEWVRLRFPLGATVFGWTELCTWLRARARSEGRTLPVLALDPPPLIPIDLQFETLHTTGTYAAQFPGAMQSRVGFRQFAESVSQGAPCPLRSKDKERLETALSAYAQERGVNVAGYFHYAAGVGSSVRTLTRALDAAGIPHQDVTLPVDPSRMTSSSADPARLPARYFKQYRPDYEVNITVVNADAMRSARAFLGPGYEHCRRHIGYWVWETDSLPGRCAAAAEGLEAIWTPSEFSARGIRRTLGSSVPVAVIPHSVAPPQFGAPAALPFSLPNGVTLFGFFFDARSVIERKNPADLLRAFRLAFKKDDRVALVLKVSHPESAPDTMRRLEALADGLRVVWLRDERLDDAQISTLLSKLDVYASLHRAEGFGLGLAEAMALGKPVVATGFSGNLEFMDERSARLVRYREVVTERAYGAYPRGTRWAQPDVEHAAEIFRKLAGSRELRSEIGKRARQRIEETLAPRVVARTLLEQLGWETGRSVPGAAEPADDAAGPYDREEPGTGARAGRFDRLRAASSD